MRLRPSLAAIAAGLLLAACGGSSHPASVTTTAVASRTTSSTGFATAAPTASATSAAPAATATTTSATTTTTSASAPPEVPKAKRARTHRGGSRAAAQGLHVVAKMTVTASGSLSPPTVAIPSGVGVELHLTNHGSAARTVVLDGPGRPTARLGPGANGGLETAGKHSGTYSILVDGTPRGQLMFGAQGGP